MATFTKQPGDVLDYDVEMDKWFASMPEDWIQTVELSVSSPMEATPLLELGPLPHPAYERMGEEPKRFKVWVGAGTNNVNYKITCLVTTRQDRKKEVELKIKVRDK